MESSTHKEEKKSTLTPPIPFPLSSLLLSQLQCENSEYAACRGILMYNKKTQQLTPAPFTLLPTPFPKSCFQQAWELCSDFNILNHEISKNYKFIVDVSESVVDPFTSSLLDIYKQVYKEGIKQKITLAIVRSDYMLHTNSPISFILQQVEINTIAASFSNLSAFVSEMHRFVIQKLEINEYNVQNIAYNQSLEKIPFALFQAWKLYGNTSSVVIMLIHEGENNTFDQRWLEYLLWDKYQVRLIRRSFLDFYKRGKLNSETRELTIDGKIVAVCYYRAGYSPDDYPSEKEWEARLMIERSMAIKCPNIIWHLLGTKKMQQVLSGTNILEQFLNNKAQCTRIRACFAGLYGLGENDPGIEEIVAKALTHPEDYVLKPQREGGGNNYYGKDLYDILSKSSPKQRAAYILMDRIRPPPIPTIFLREGKIIKGTGVSELGIYGVFINDGNSTLLNEPGGYLLRTKISNVEDGGVAAGVAVLDTPYLTDD